MAVSDRSGVHFNGPIKNKVKRDGARKWYNDLPVSESPELVTLFNDFLMTQDYAATDWTQTITQAGAGSAAIALDADALNGALKILNDDASGDKVSMQLNEENWACTAGKQLWYETRIKVSDPTLVNMMMSLGITDTTPLSTSSSIGFKLASGSAALSCHSTASSSTTTTSSIATLSANTYVKLGLHWDGKNRIQYFVNGSQVAEHTTNIPSVNLAVTCYIENGSAVAQSLIIDYIYVAQER